LEKAHLRSTATRSPEGSRAAYCFITFDSRHQGNIAEMPPALAFGSRSSVFKEQPRTKTQTGRGAWHSASLENPVGRPGEADF